MRRLLAHRNARLYLSAQAMSLLGDGALWLAMGIWIKVLTGSSAAAGLSFFALALGSAGGPLGGMLADKVRRRPLLIVTNLATAGLVLLLLGDANGVLQTAQQGLRLVTPLAGAGLFAVFGPAPVIIGDAATFLVAVVTLLAIRIAEDRPAPAGQRWLAELTAGARHIARTVVLRQLAVTAAVVVTAYGLSETVLFAVVSEGLHRPAAFLGVLISAQGAGAIAAGIVAAPLIRRLGEGLLASLSWIIVAVMTLFQRRTPPELRGRTDAAFTVAYTVPQTMAIALGAGLIAVLNYRILLLVIAGLMALAAGYLGTRREQRRAGATEIPEIPEPAAAMAD